MNLFHYSTVEAKDNFATVYMYIVDKCHASVRHIWEAIPRHARSCVLQMRNDMECKVDTVALAEAGLFRRPGDDSHCPQIMFSPHFICISRAFQ